MVQRAEVLEPVLLYFAIHRKPLAAFLHFQAGARAELVDVVRLVRRADCGLGVLAVGQAEQVAVVPVAAVDAKLQWAVLFLQAFQFEQAHVPQLPLVDDELRGGGMGVRKQAGRCNRKQGLSWHGKGTSVYDSNIETQAPV
jgi:hypothetical protein